LICFLLYSFQDISLLSDLNIRPSNIKTELNLLSNLTDLYKQSILDALHLVDNNIDLTIDTGICSDICLKYSNDENLILPPPSEGHRVVRYEIDDKSYVYQFGGYGCVKNGIQSLGGSDCYFRNMYILDTSTLLWRVVEPPEDTDPTFKYWPTRRAYHTMTLDHKRSLIWIIGGAYQSYSGELGFLNDIFAFDLLTDTFIATSILGVGPAPAWSGSAAMWEDNLIYYGGASSVEFFNDVFILKIDETIHAQNCSVSGTGIIQT
jgi:hypothetical protein